MTSAYPAAPTSSFPDTRQSFSFTGASGTATKVVGLRLLPQRGLISGLTNFKPTWNVTKGTKRPCRPQVGASLPYGNARSEARWRPLRMNLPAGYRVRETDSQERRRQVPNFNSCYPTSESHRSPTVGFWLQSTPLKRIGTGRASCQTSACIKTCSVRRDALECVTKLPLMTSQELTGFLGIKQFRDIDLQCQGDTRQHLNRRVTNTPLDTADISAVKPAIGRKIFLADIALLSEPPQVPANALSDVHRPVDQAMRLISPRLISLILLD